MNKRIVMDYTSQEHKAMVLKSAGRLQQLYIGNITYIEGDSYLSIIHFFNCKETESFSKLLKELESELSPYGFIRISKKVLLNMKFFKYLKGQNKKKIIVLTDNSTKLTISTRKLSILNHFFQIAI